ncbi:recombinase family protein [Nonomuraea guangzhouensis]|uniref:Recombinase family protein n=1 Tax=Nonomuraea guangzhouensis TaxID=1291555 RepID=A0ABW4G820_9ACTN
MSDGKGPLAGRVSTHDQNPGSRRVRLTDAGCERVYIDTISGTLSSRLEFDTAMDALLMAAGQRSPFGSSLVQVPGCD